MWLIVLYLIFVPVCGILVLSYLNKPYNPPLFGVYEQKNKLYQIKFLFMYTFLQIRQWITLVKRVYAVESGKSCDGTIEIHRDDEAIEQKFYIADLPNILDIRQVFDKVWHTCLIYKIKTYLPHNYFLLPQSYLMDCLFQVRESHAMSPFFEINVEVPQGIVISPGVDAVYFNGVSSEGEAIVCGIARRPQQVCDAFLYIKLKDEELLLSLNFPDTYHQQDSKEAGDYKIKGLKISKFIPMRTWQVTYDGEMKVRNNDEKKVKVKANLTWSALWGPFNYDFQMSPRSMARDMAREPWSREFFQRLKKCHQTHYEQMGSLKGYITVNEKEHYVRLPCVRDHSFGKFRDWSTFHRYALHFIFLDNGDSMAIGTVSQPGVLSHLTIGYLCRKSDQSVIPVDESDFYLYQHGENQLMPKDYGFTFKAGRVQYAVRVQVEDEVAFYMDKTRVSKIYERWSTVEVNGVKGRACLEWLYNNTQKSE